MREIRMSGVTRGEVIGGGRPSPTLLANILIHGKQVKFVCQKKKLDLGYRIVI